MSPLKTALAAGVAFVVGWAAHEGLARQPRRFESTAPYNGHAADTAKREADEKAYKEAVIKASGGMVTEDGQVIAPLNVRDPSALVMGPSVSGQGETCREVAPAKPCDCAGDKLRKTGRDAPERF